MQVPRWTTVSLRTKGLLIVALPVLPVLCFWLVVGITVVRRPPAANTTGRSLQVQADLARVFSALLDADAGVRDALLTTNQAALRRYQSAVGRVTRGLTDLDRAVIDADLRAAVTRLTALAEEDLALFDSLTAPAAAPTVIGERAGFDRSAAILEQIRGLIATIESRQMQLAAQRSAATQRAKQRFFGLLLIGSIVCTTAGVTMALLLVRTINHRHKVLARNADRLARGEEPEPLPAGEDEIRVLDERFREAARQLRQREADLRARTTALESANRELESFSYSVSHDLRAPLRAIAGFSQALEEDSADRLDDAGRDALRRVRAAATRMGLIIDDLLKLSQLGRMELHRETVDVTATASGIAADLARHAPARHVALSIAPGLTASADPRMLRIALENLLDNAWKYTAKAPAAQIEVGVSANGGPAVYHVRDNGAGFDPRYADKLFGAFQRLHADHEFPGIGIGLATVKRIIHRHGGRIWAEGAVEAGAAFYFTLEPGTDHP